jgi:hypothetical protein
MTRWSCRRPQSIWSCLAQMGYLARRTLRRRRLVPADGGSAPEPGRENIPGCIHVPIVQLTAVSTRPRPHSKVSQTPGSREGATVRTRSRGVSLVHDDDRSAGVLALIQQHLLEHAPTGIQHGGGQPCLRQFQAAGGRHPAADGESADAAAWPGARRASAAAGVFADPDPRRGGIHRMRGAATLPFCSPAKVAGLPA